MAVAENMPRISSCFKIGLCSTTTACCRPKCSRVRRICPTSARRYIAGRQRVHHVARRHHVGDGQVAVLAATFPNHIDRPFTHGVTRRNDADHDIIELRHKQQSHPARDHDLVGVAQRGIRTNGGRRHAPEVSHDAERRTGSVTVVKLLSCRQTAPGFRRVDWQRVVYCSFHLALPLFQKHGYPVKGHQVQQRIVGVSQSPPATVNPENPGTSRKLRLAQAFGWSARTRLNAASRSGTSASHSAALTG